MKKWTLALLGATTAFALSSGAAMASTATIFDAVDVPPPSSSPAYSQGYAGGWHDHYNFGTDNPGRFFSSGNFSVTWNGASNENVTLTFFSYMPQAGATGANGYWYESYAWHPGDGPQVIDIASTWWDSNVGLVPLSDGRHLHQKKHGCE